MLGGCTAGAREMLEDPNALDYARYEYFGRTFAVAASLYSQHEKLIDDLLRPAYMAKHGKQMAALVQRSFLRDVVVPDLACVVSNPQRRLNPWVTERLKQLKRTSAFEEVRATACEIVQGFVAMTSTGRQDPAEEP